MSEMMRYTAAPTKFDLQPYGTLCMVVKNDECTESDYFIQRSQDPNEAIWVSAKELLVEVYKERLQDPEFIRSLLDKIK